MTQWGDNPPICTEIAGPGHDQHFDQLLCRSTFKPFTLARAHLLSGFFFFFLVFFAIAITFILLSCLYYYPSLSVMRCCFSDYSDAMPFTPSLFHGLLTVIELP